MTINYDLLNIKAILIILTLHLGVYCAMLYTILINDTINYVLKKTLKTYKYKKPLTLTPEMEKNEFNCYYN